MQTTIAKLSQIRDSLQTKTITEGAPVLQFGIRGLMLLFLPSALLALAIEKFGIGVGFILLWLVTYLVFCVGVASIFHYSERIKATFWDHYS